MHNKITLIIGILINVISLPCRSQDTIILYPLYLTEPEIWDTTRHPTQYIFEGTKNSQLIVSSNGMYRLRHYYETGQMKSEVDVIPILATDSSFTYKDKRPILIIPQKIIWSKNGLYLEWDLDGKLKTSGYYYHGQEIGKWKHFKKNEIIIEEK